MEELVRTMEKTASDLERLAGELRAVASRLAREARAPSPVAAAAPSAPAAQESPPVAAQPTDAKAAVAGLARIAQAASSSYLVARADYSFVEQAPGILEKLSGDDLRGRKGQKFLYQVLCMIDGLAASYRSPGFQGLRKVCEQAAAALVPHLEAHGVRVVPHPGERGDWSELERAPVSSALPEGIAVAVKKRALLKEGETLEQGEVLVSNGKWGPPQELLDSVAEAVMGGGSSGNDALDHARHKAWQEVRSYLEELASADTDKLYTLYRYAANAVNRLPPAGPVKDAMSRLIDALREGGFREIPAPLGRKFDESFSPSRYERKRVKSDRAPDTIVEIIQRGFVNEKGVPVQKAIVGVSAGR